MSLLLFAIKLTIDAFAFFLFNNMLFFSVRKKKNVLFIYSSAFLFFFIFHCIFPDAYVFINLAILLVIYMIILIVLYDLNFISAMTHAVLISCVYIISDTIVVDYLRYYTFNASDLISTVISFSVFFLITTFLAIIEKKYNKTKNKSTEVGIILTIASLCFISALFNFLGIIKTKELERKDFYLSLNAFVYILILAMLVNIINCIVIKEKISTREEQLFISMQDTSDYITELKNRDVNQRLLIHDIKKHLNAIHLLAQSGKIEDINKYLEKMYSSPALFSPIRYCLNDFLNALLYKYKKAASCNSIDFCVESTPAFYCDISNFDLTIILCNLLDNAIVAAQGKKDGYININLSKNVETDEVKFFIVNSCSKTIKFTNNLPSKTSSSSSTHGLGIKSVLSVVNKYNGDLLMYQDENNDFHTIVLLKTGEKG